MSTSSFPVSVRPELIRWARESSGFTGEQLAKTAGVEPATWDAWEAGRARPTFRQLERIAKRCRRPVALFYLPDPPREEVAPEDFRRLPGAMVGDLAPETLVTFRRARRLQTVAVEALDLGKPGADRWLPRLDPTDDREAAGNVLRALLSITVEAQKSWRDESEAYRQWRRSVERIGVLVFQFRMPLENARGFSLWHDRLPVVVVNSADSYAARGFTVFHELAHLVIRTPGVCLPGSKASLEPDGHRSDVERFCNRSAASSLLPLEDESVRAALHRAAQSPSNIEDEATAFKVSREAMLWRLVDAGQMSRDGARHIASGWANQRAEAAPAKKRSGGPRLTVRRLAERGLVFSTAVLDALDERRITYPDASEFLDLSTRQLDDFREEVSRRLEKTEPDE